MATHVQPITIDVQTPSTFSNNVIIDQTRIIGVIIMCWSETGATGADASDSMTRRSVAGRPIWAARPRRPGPQLQGIRSAGIPADGSAVWMVA